MASRRIVLVHAHPDDETLQTGGLMARYAAEGVHVCLVTCTNGELGEVAPVPELGTVEEITERLAEVRIAELRESVRILGCEDLRLLGYHDSGMDGTDGNRDPAAFVNQDLERPARDVVAILRELEPQVVVTYNEFGFYGHPDHIRAHEVTLRAVDAAADPSYAPELGPPHQVAKLYYTAVAKSFLRAGREMATQMDVDPDDFFDEASIEQVGTEDEFITTWLDCAAYVDAKFAALEAHKTQLGTTQGFLKIPQDVRAAALGTENYVLVRSTVGMPDGRESDLFERIPR